MASRTLKIDVEVDANGAITRLGRVDRAVDDIGNSSTRTGSAISTMIGTFAGMVSAQAVLAVVSSTIRNIGTGIRDVLASGAEFAPVHASFQELSAAAGGADLVLSTLRASTQGLVSDMDLMLASNKAINLGLPATAESMGELSETAILLGRSMGVTATQAVDDLITGLGRMSPQILDNLGLTVSAAQANEVYAAQLGISAAALTEADRKQAFYNEALRAAGLATANLTDQQLTLSERWQQGRVFLENLTARVGEAVQSNEMFAAGAEFLAETFERVFGSDTQQLVDDIIAKIEEWSLKGLKATDLVVRGFGVLFDVFTAFPRLYNSFVVIPLVDANIVIGNSIAGMLESASALPGVGRLFAAMAQDVREGVFQLQRLSDHASLAVTEIGEMGSSISSASATLQGMIAAMQGATGATFALADGATGAAQAVFTANDAEVEAIQIAAPLIASNQAIAQSYDGVTDAAHDTADAIVRMRHAAGEDIEGQTFTQRASGRRPSPFTNPLPRPLPPREAGSTVADIQSGFFRRGANTIVNVDARGALFESDASINRLADTLAQVLVTQGRLGPASA